jgi:AraC family transcriptional regulator, transcriptional activator of the genes for pyochelin and ferripyochelin receptors
MTEHTIHDAEGAMQMIHLRPGLKLRIAGFKPGKTVKMRFKSEASCLRFTFLRDGKGYMTRHAGGGPAVKNKVYPIERSSSVSFEPELEGSVCFPVGHRQSHFSIQISQSLMNTLLGGRFQRVPYDLQAILDGCNNIDFYHYGPLTPVMDSAIQQLLNCPYSGPLGLIYQESKAIELIAHKLAQIESSAKSSPTPNRMRLDDIERVRHARDILMRNLESPPRLFDLAAAAGTSHTQLNRCFQKVYGTSVFGFLRKMRLEEARHLLEKGGMNVTEAAFTVGYNSISSFSRAFSEHFGSSPLSFRKKA